MFGTSTAKAEKPEKGEEPKAETQTAAVATPETPDLTSESKRRDDVSPVRAATDDIRAPEEPPPSSPTEKKRRTGSVSKAKDLFSSARQSLTFGSSPDKVNLSAMQRLSKVDPALGVPQGSLNNSAGESLPGPHSTFRVGVTEDKNKKCRKTMEDTHAYLYNFLSTPKIDPDSQNSVASAQVVETDNGYFAIFDGHAGTFAADWCGKKLHLLLEETIRKHPNTPLPELLDQTFTQVDKELEKLPLKNSGTTAVTAVLRWEDRVPNPASATGTAFLNQAAAKDAKVEETGTQADTKAESQGNGSSGVDLQKIQASEAKLRGSAIRQRVLYTANVGDARIILCRNGRALRLSYDHKGSDEGEGRRISNAGGLILNNRVNGVLAVTRALGDTYMKDLVTGHPYTTETVIQPEHDEFLILACDGLWDVCSDQEAVDLVRNIEDPQTASKTLVEHALGRFSTDNLSCMVVRFDNKALKSIQEESSIGVEGDHKTVRGGISEADAIVSEARKQQDDGGSHDGTAEIPPEIAEKLEEEVANDRAQMNIHLNKEAALAAQKNPS